MLALPLHRAAAFARAGTLVTWAPLALVLAASAPLALCATGCAPDADPAVLATWLPARVHRPDVRRLGRLDPDAHLELVLGVRGRREALDRLLADQADPTSNRYGQFISPAEFAAQFGATDEDYEALATLCAHAGLEITQRAVGHGTLSVGGRAADIERLFGTHLTRYEDAKGTYFAPADSLDLDPRLGALIDSAVGLTDAVRWRSHRKDPPPSANAVGGALDPVDLTHLYGGDVAPASAYHGENETVAILGTGDPPRVMSDVEGFVKYFQLDTKWGANRQAQYNRVLIGGPNRDSVSLAQQEYGENLLDIDMVWSLAPRANVVHVLTATNAPGMFTDGLAYIVNQVPQAHAASLSYGLCERFSISEVLVMNQILAQAKAEGQQWLSPEATNHC
jgi:kumamolisin